ncbi:ATP-binding protein [uncultured Sphaerochaeta sp.]|uniref:ATP-binding protein n=1 Tax=uncultured Sphaerochaeta sp. TaxID=886478 RepID=UPI002A0A8B2D|nr:ATP-binding protein [uncultured Sphaerochaeta sp.]
MRKDLPIKRSLAGTMLFLLVPAICNAAPLIQPKYSESMALPFVIGLVALGVLFGLLWYNIFLALSTREKMFFYFSLIMVLLTILQTFSTYDRFFFFLTYNRVTIITHLLFMTFLLFFEELFSIRDHDKRLSSFNRVNIVVIGGYVVLFLLLKILFPTAERLHTTLNFIRELFVFYTNALFLYTIIRAMVWMKREAILLLVAFIPPAFTTSVNALNIFPFMQGHEQFTTFLMQYNQPIGLSLQAILFSLAVGNRYNRIKMERQEASRTQELLFQRTRFFLNMSHETRTPLTVILGLVRQLKQENAALTIKQAESMLSAIERNSLILLRQVNHMLRLERRRDIKVETALPLVPLTSLLINAFLPIAQEKNIALEFDASLIPPKLGLMVRQEDYESMVMNLLSNAIKYSGGGGCVVVSLQQVDSHELLLAVSDTGIGIAPEDQERIFEQFEVVEDASSSMQTGLGLPLVKHILEEYGGAIELESRLGEGSVFILRFPSLLLHQTETTVSESELEHLYLSEFRHLEMECPETPSDSPTILVVEDNDDLRWYIQSILQKKYRVLSASSADRALQLLEKEDVALIISDVMMPQMDGHAFLKEVRMRFVDTPIPLIFLTARDSMEEKIDSLAEGAIRYLTKPFRSEVLLAIIESILSHDQALIGSRIQQFREGLNVLLDVMEHPSHGQKRPYMDELVAACNLSEREKQVLHLISEGKSDKEIGLELSLSVKTVANHNRNIYAKCKVSGRYELLAKLYGDL